MDQIPIHNPDPAWPTTTAEGISIKWQVGTCKGQSLNGARIEGVIRAAMFRLEDYQRGPTACEQNRLAIGHLQEAIHLLQQRTAERYRRGVIGTERP